MPPPPPPPPLPPPPSTATLDRRIAPPPPPPPPSLGGLSTISSARPPPPPPAASRRPPLAPAAPTAPAYRLSNLPPAPPVAPALPDTPRMSEELYAASGHSPKFPSFTMDLPDITNVSHSRNSAYSSAQPRHISRGSFSTLGPVFAAEHGERQSAVEKPWDKPLDYATMSVAPSSRAEDEDDEEEDAGFDVPDRLTLGPGAVAARLDLQRCTIRVHKQLVDQIKTNSMKPAGGGGGPGGVSENRIDAEELSRCQGELWLKSRVPMMGWKKRYGSIVDHAYFGPVLFLFKFDAKGSVGLHHSMMIVLVDSHVRLGKNSTTKDRDYRCEFVLKTTKRRYVMAANHTMRRDYWLRNLETIQQQASTSYA